MKVGLGVALSPGNVFKDAVVRALEGVGALDTANDLISFQNLRKKYYQFAVSFMTREKGCSAEMLRKMEDDLFTQAEALSQNKTFLGIRDVFSEAKASLDERVSPFTTPTGKGLDEDFHVLSKALMEGFEIQENTVEKGLAALGFTPSQIKDFVDKSDGTFSDFVPDVMIEIFDFFNTSVNEQLHPGFAALEKEAMKVKSGDFKAFFDFEEIKGNYKKEWPKTIKNIPETIYKNMPDLYAGTPGNREGLKAALTEAREKTLAFLNLKAPKHDSSEEEKDGERDVEIEGEYYDWPFDFSEDDYPRPEF